LTKRKIRRDIAEAYGISQSTLSKYLKDWDMTEKEAMEFTKIAKRKKI
jgi:predicted transcriptional regulator